MDVKFPNVKVKLVGCDGNAFYIIGKVSAALRRAKVSEVEIKEFQTRCTSGNYDNVLQTCLDWVDVS